MNDIFKNNNDEPVYAVTTSIVLDSFFNLLRDQDNFVNIIRTGKQDEIFKDKPDYFHQRYQFFKSKEEALQYINKTASADAQMYLLTLKGPKEKVEQSATEGKFSQSILQIEKINQNENREAMRNGHK